MKLMNASANFVAAESDDYAFDLPPVTEARDIAGVAAALSARGCFEPGIVAEALEEVGRVGKRRPPGDERGIHGL